MSHFNPRLAVWWLLKKTLEFDSPPLKHFFFWILKQDKKLLSGLCVINLKQLCQILAYLFPYGQRKKRGFQANFTVLDMDDAPCWSNADWLTTGPEQGRDRWQSSLGMERTWKKI